MKARRAIPGLFLICKTSLILANSPTAQPLDTATLCLGIKPAFLNALAGACGDAVFGLKSSLADHLDQTVLRVPAVGFLSTVAVGSNDDDAVFGQL